MSSERAQAQIDSPFDEAKAVVRALDRDTMRARSEAVLCLDPRNEAALVRLSAGNRDAPRSGTAPQPPAKRGPAAVRAAE